MKYLTTILMAIAAIIPLTSFAQDNTTQPDALAFTIDGNVNLWEKTEDSTNLDWPDGEFITHLNSRSIAGNTGWYADYFGINSITNNYIYCGTSYVNTKASIYHDSSISYSISKVAIKANILLECIECLNSMSLYVSSNFDMTDAIQLKYDGDFASSGTYVFNIPDPKPNMFYKVEFDSSPTAYIGFTGTNRKKWWINVNSLSFYRQLSPTPLINKIYNADNKIDHIEVLSEIGDLHLLVNEYDLDGNHIREVIGPNVPTQNAPAKAAPEYPADWTNQVAEANTAYNVNLPTDPNRMILIRAKSVNDGIHSTETSTIFTDAGIETGISSISTDTYDNTTIYYNMQGIRVERPSDSGLYLRVQNGKTTKIHIP